MGTAERILGAMKRAGVVAILILAFCGIADSAYILQHEVAGTSLLCDTAGLIGCTTVATSPYSFILGIPLAEYGVIFYSILFILAALELVIASESLRHVLQIFTGSGLLVSIYFVYVQLFVINAFCVYCLISVMIALLGFLAASVIEPVRKHIPHKQPSSSAPLAHFSMPPMS